MDSRAVVVGFVVVHGSGQRRRGASQSVHRRLRHLPGLRGAARGEVACLLPVAAGCERASGGACAMRDKQAKLRGPCYVRRVLVRQWARAIWRPAVERVW